MTPADKRIESLAVEKTEEDWQETLALQKQPGFATSPRYATARALLAWREEQRRAS